MEHFGRSSVTLLGILFSVLAPELVLGESPHTERDVAFRNGDVELRGTLVTPSGEAPVPAVVFLHGSGPHTREGFTPYAEELARLGVASLRFDKRGTGESGGSWVSSSLEDLAEDALAAVRFLERQERIDGRRIGFWGVSQAGWVAPVAAARSDAVAFLIVISGGGVTPRESEMYSYAQQFDRFGLSASSRDEANRILDAYFDFLASGEGRVELLADLERIRQGELEPLAEQLGRILPSEENRPNWSWVGAYDPASDIAQLDIPVLLLFGDRDRDQPTDKAVARWREGLAGAGNDRATIVVFPGAGHGIRMGGHHGGEGRGAFADGYMEVQLGWLWLHVVATGDHGADRE